MTAYFRKKKSSIREFRPDLRLWSIASLILFFAATLGAGAATTWKGPVSPPTDVSNLESPIDFSDLVSRSILQKQTLQGPIYVRNADANNKDNFPARLGLQAKFTKTEVYTLGYYAKNTALTIGSDGLPIIAFQGKDEDLETVWCSTVECDNTSTNVWTEIDKDPLYNTGAYPSIKIGSDGFPIISYHRKSSPGAIMIVHCTSFSCQTHDNPVILKIGTTANYGRYNSVGISNGLPVVSYYNSDTGSLNVISCNNISCTSFNDPVVIDDGSSLGQYTSVTIASDGKPLIAYKGDDNELRVAHCTTYTCSSSTVSSLPAAAAHADISLAVNSANGNLPIVGYTNASDQVLVANCANVNCTALDASVPTKLIGSNARESSVAIGSDDFPVMTYNYFKTSPVEGKMMVAHCADYKCVSLNPGSPVVVDTGLSQPLGDDTFIAIGSDSLPIITYTDNTSHNVYVVHCANLACDWVGTRKVGALGIGKAPSPRGFLPEFGEGNYGVMGYAAGGGANYGIYGYSASGVGIGAKVSQASDFAGYFSGPVLVENSPDGPVGNVTAQYAESTAGMLTNSTIAAAVHLAATTERGITADAFIAQTTVASGDTDAGAVGKSTLNSSSGHGVLVTSQNKLTTAYADNELSYGVYGFGNNGTAVGTGVIGEVSTVPALAAAQGVYGEGVDYGVYGKGVFTVGATQTGAGVFACGTQEAGRFAGNIRVLGSLTMGVQTDAYSGGPPPTLKTVNPEVTLTESRLQQISTAAMTAGYPGAALTPLP